MYHSISSYVWEFHAQSDQQKSILCFSLSLILPLIKWFVLIILLLQSNAKFVVRLKNYFVRLTLKCLRKPYGRKITMSSHSVSGYTVGKCSLPQSVSVEGNKVVEHLQSSVNNLQQCWRLANAKNHTQMTAVEASLCLMCGNHLLYTCVLCVYMWWRSY